MARGRFTLAASLTSVFSLALVVSLRATGDWRGAVVVGTVGAAQAAASAGFFDQLMASFVPRVRAAAEAATQQGSGLAAPTSTMGTSTPDLSGGGLPPTLGNSDRQPGQAAPCEGPDCPESEGGAGSAAGETTASGDASAMTDAEKEEAMRLALVRMKARGTGETRNYGNSPMTRRAASAPPDSAAFESAFSGMVQKLKGRAAANAPQLGGGAAGEGGGSGGEGDGESPILTKNGIDPKYDSPTLRALQRVNANGAHSLKMGSDPGMEDGSRDHAGKSFDGNLNTFMDIPIEEKKGAMGRSQITVGHD